MFGRPNRSRYTTETKINLMQKEYSLVSTNTHIIRLYWKEVRKFKPSFFTGLFAIPLAALSIDTLMPYFLSLAVGALAVGQFNTIPQLLWLAGGIGVVGVVMNVIGFQALIAHESAVGQSLRSATLAKLLNKDSDFFANQKIGGLTGKFIDFINAHVALQDLVIIQTLRFLLSFGIGLTLIFIGSPVLGGFILVLLILLGVQVRLSLKLRRPLRHARKEMIAKINGAVADTVTNNQAVKSFGNEHHEQSITAALGEEYKHIYRKDFRLMSIEGSGRLLISVILQVVAVGILAYLLSRSLVTVGVAVFTVAYLQRVAGQLFSLGEMINGYDKIFLQAGPMADILTEDPHITDAKNAKPIVIKKGTLSFQSVQYRYPDAKNDALSGLSFTIKGGQKIGLVGRSGAGKTTITRLLLRLDDVTAGTILVDGQKLSKVTQVSLRHAIAYVPQEPLLFHRSLRENIAYGKLDATDQEIIEAATKAYAMEFIQKLPDGLDTIVGERGVKLSGGQRQRIAIARAILKDAPILILDEATSALDSESEVLIQKALSTLMEGRTSIVIAHRLSTISKLDRVVVLDNGKVSEDGSHDALLKSNGTYAKLWAHQSGGFIQED